MIHCCREIVLDIAFVLIALLSVVARVDAADAPLFPFVVSYDAPDNITNISDWLKSPAGNGGFVRVRDGHFVTDAGPIRFWGTNLCFEACFPSHEEAERVAARMARFGINVVRMHHMDSRHIWGESPDKLTIDPKQLERLDYLIAQLKKHGIYTNLNLHVSRWLGPKEGFTGQNDRPKYDKGLDNFEPRMIELQKKYARDLMTHVNPYTGKAYANEPAVAFVEINNENAAFTGWSRGALDNLPDPYLTTFRKLWNAWLRKKYRSTSKVGAAWNTGSQPLGKEILVNGDFSSPLAKTWSLQRDAQSDVDFTVTDNGPDGQKNLRVVVRKQGRESWIPQFSQGRLAVKKGTAYTLTFFLRSEKSAQISLNCMMNHEPWNRLGLSASANVDREWRQHRFTFIAEKDDDNARVTFSSLKPGTYEFASVSLRPGGITGLEPDERIEDDSVAVLLWSQRGVTEARRHDFIDFLWDTEHEYWLGMYRFLKEDLKVQSLVSGTQLSYSPVHIQAKLDYIDAHSYWEHPHFPNRPWDGNDWYVRNIALVNSPGGTLASLAERRVAGLPYTVSEYNHPAPNSYAAEGFPMIAAMAAFQDWDGVYSFTYSHSREFEPRKISSYFNILSDPTKLVHMPACAALFLRGDVAPARRTVHVPLPAEAERRKMHETGTPWKLTAENFGVDRNVSLLHRLDFDIQKTVSRGSHKSSPDAPTITPDTAQFKSDTNQIHWDVSKAGAGYLSVDTEHTKLFTGFVAGRTFQFGDVKLSLGPTRNDWATISMVCLDGDGFNRPGRILIAATGLAENTGAKLEDLGDNRVTLRRQWGTEPSLCEGIPATIVLPVSADRVRVYPLDESGARRSPISCTVQGNAAQLELSPKHHTLWYEVEIR